MMRPYSVPAIVQQHTDKIIITIILLMMLDDDDEDNGIVCHIVSMLLICFSFSKYHLTYVLGITKPNFGARICVNFCAQQIHAHAHMQACTFIVFSPHICVINKRVMYMRAYTDFQTYYITPTEHKKQQKKFIGLLPITHFV